MADKIDITPGTGKTVATDDCGVAGHTQIVKLAVSTDGAATVLPADATYGLGVDVKRVSGNVPVIGPTAHDAAASTAPVVTAGVASAAAPTSVSADGDVVQDWNLRNGAKATVITAAGALIPGDAANGLDVDVTRLPALVAGTANIGDVDVLTVPADPFGVNADAASATGSISAKLRFIAATGIPVTALPASTNTLEVVGDVAHDAPAAGNPVLQGGYAKAAAPTNVSADGDAVNSWHLLNGAQCVNVTAAGALIPGDASNGLDVDVTRVPTDPFGANADAASATGSVSAKLRFIAATGIPVTALPASTNTLEVVGDVAHDAPAAGNPVLLAGYASAAAPSDVSGDADAARLWTLRNGALAVNVTAAGALIPGDATNGLKVQPSGNVAHDAVDSGNPTKIGARAAATLSDDTMVANADRTDLVSDLDGALIVRPGIPLGDLISEVVTNTNGTSTAFSNFGAVANTRSFITAIVVYNSSATAGTVDFRDGTAGSVLWTMPIPAGGGSVLPAGLVPYFKTTANTALAFDVSGALSTVTISIAGFKSKVV